MSRNYLIIGGGLAAGRAVEGIRELDSRGKITLVCEEPHLPYDRPPLSKGALSEGVELKEIALHTRMYYLLRRARLKLGVSVEQIAIDGSRRIARLSDGSEIEFNRCIMATGARPRVPEIAGRELSGVSVLRSYDDAKRIHDLVAASSTAGSKKRVVIVGAGFIGLEAAASLAKAGVEVAVVEMKGSVWPSVAPPELSAFLQAELAGLAVTFHFGSGVTAFEGSDAVEAVRLENGELLPAELVLSAIGVAPRVELAEAAGLEVDDGIVVDEQLRTSVEGVWAAGDVASLPEHHAGRRRRLEHYGSAEATGYLAGRNAAGAGDTFSMLPYVWSDIGRLRVDIAGDETGWERTVIRGEIDGEAPRFLIFGLSGNRLVAYFSVGSSDAERSAAQLLIKQRIDLSPIEASLSDPQEPLQQLVQRALSQG